MERRHFIRGMGVFCLLPSLNFFEKNEMMLIRNDDLHIRVHHFYDIIRDFGINPVIEADLTYKHSYHKVADLIRLSPDLNMKIVVGIDAVCEGCIHLKNNTCDDPLTVIPGFTFKNEYNNYLDNLILNVIETYENDNVTPKELCILAKKYIADMYTIYELASTSEIDKRKKEFIAGLKYYSHINNFNLDFLFAY
jgi:hypothetical protein